jgi:hypothetical protein
MLQSGNSGLTWSADGERLTVQHERALWKVVPMIDPWSILLAGHMPPSRTVCGLTGRTEQTAGPLLVLEDTSSEHRFVCETISPDDRFDPTWDG